MHLRVLVLPYVFYISLIFVIGLIVSLISKDFTKYLIYTLVIIPTTCIGILPVIGPLIYIFYLTNVVKSIFQIENHYALIIDFCGLINSISLTILTTRILIDKLIRKRRL